MCSIIFKKNIHRGKQLAYIRMAHADVGVLHQLGVNDKWIALRSHKIKLITLK